MVETEMWHFLIYLSYKRENTFIYVFTYVRRVCAHMLIYYPKYEMTYNSDLRISSIKN